MIVTCRARASARRGSAQADAGRGGRIFVRDDRKQTGNRRRGGRWRGGRRLHHLAPARREVVLHALGVWEEVLVPRHVAFPDGVLDVEPEHVVRDVVLVELPVHLPASCAAFSARPRGSAAGRAAARAPPRPRTPAAAAEGGAAGRRGG